MEFTSADITELVAIGSLLIALIGGWVKIQTNLTRIDTDLGNLKEEFKEERKDNRVFFTEIKDAINEIKTYLLNHK